MAVHALQCERFSALSSLKRKLADASMRFSNWFPFFYVSIETDTPQNYPTYRTDEYKQLLRNLTMKRIYVIALEV